MINFKKFHNSYSKVKYLVHSKTFITKRISLPYIITKKLHMCSPASTLVRVRENTYVINTNIKHWVLTHAHVSAWVRENNATITTQ
jgi:hypothetical protein